MHNAPNEAVRAARVRFDDPALEAEIDVRVRARLEECGWRKDYSRWVDARVWQERFQEPVVRNLDELVAGWRSSRVLEIGSGMGGLLVRLELESVQVLGIE